MKGLVVVICAIGIVACTHVYVPATPEGQECVRECMIVQNTCRPMSNFDMHCAIQQKNCLRSCPGAEER